MDKAAIPEWLTWALAQPRSSHFVDSGGTSIHYAAWNASDALKPALLLAHGFLGHTHWWDFIAPFLTKHFRVFALDFSGMGQSGHRAEYSADCFVGDLAAVLGAIHLPGMAASTVVGHSFGGGRVMQACTQVPELIGHAIVLDSYARFHGDERSAYAYRPAPKPYPDEATAVSHFRLLPPQYAEPCLVEHIARHSIRQVEGGWAWRFDPALRNVNTPQINPDLLGRVTMPVDYVHAEASAVVSAERAQHIVDALPHCRGPIALPRTGHHMMLDQPLALIGVLRALLA